MGLLLILGIAIIVGLIIIFSIIDWSKVNTKAESPPKSVQIANVTQPYIPSETKLDVQRDIVSEHSRNLTNEELRDVNAQEHPVYVQPPLEHVRETSVPRTIYNRLGAYPSATVISDPAINNYGQYMTAPIIKQQPMISTQPQQPMIPQQPIQSTQPHQTQQPIPSPKPIVSTQPQQNVISSPKPITLPQPVITLKHTMVDIKSGPSTDNTSAGTGCSGSFDFRSGSTAPSASIEEHDKGQQQVDNSAKSSPIVTIGIKPYIKNQQSSQKQNNHRSHKQNDQHSLPKHTESKYGRTDRVIDACSFSDSIVTLINDGTIIRKPEASDFSSDTSSSKIDTTVTSQRGSIRISNNITGLTRLEPFNGYLFGVSNGKLYKLNNTTYRSKNWTWELCAWAPTDITHTSSTHDGNHLWIQSDNNGYLFNQAEIPTFASQGLNKSQHSLSKSSTKIKRIYGLDHTIYLDIEQDTCVAHLTSKNRHTSYNNVCSALVDHEGTVIPIKASDNNQYSDVRLINWEPYYIKK